MATPRAFVDPDPARLDALLDAHPFVTLITLRDGAPDASHVPVLARLTLTDSQTQAALVLVRFLVALPLGKLSSHK